MEVDYKKDLAIDPYKLEEEWLTHSSICMKYVEIASAAQKKADRAAERFKVVVSDCKDEMEMIRAELDLEIRKDPTGYDCPLKKNGDPNPTEGWISNTIITQPKYIECRDRTRKDRGEAHEDLVNANYELAILKGVADTFSWQRKASLEAVVALQMGGYWSGPKEPNILEPGKRMIDMARDSVEQKQKEALKKDKTQTRSRRRRN